MKRTSSSPIGPTERRGAPTTTAPYRTKRLWPLFWAGLIVVSSILTFDPKLYINGDNVDYIRLAETVLRGDLWASGKYPPLFPWLLAVPQSLFGTALLPQKILVTVLFLGSGMLLMRRARRVFPPGWGEPIAWIAVTLVPVLEFGHYVMSEIPYLFLSLVALEVIERIPKERMCAWLGAALAMMATFYVRSVGASLVAAILLSLILQRRVLISKTVRLAAVCLILGLPWVLRSILGPPNPYFLQLIQVNPYHPEFGMLELAGWLERIATNVRIYLVGEIPSSLFPTYFRWSYNPPELRYEFLPWFILWIPLGLLAVGLLRSLRRREAAGFYVLFYLALNLLWPRLWTGLRFLVPLLPLLFFMMFEGALWLLGLVGDRFPRRPRLALVLVGIWVLLGARNQATLAGEVRSYPTDWDAYFRAAVWIRDYAPSEAIIVDRKATMLAYVTGRTVIPFPREQDTEKMIAWMKREEVDLVVVPPLPYDDIVRYLIPAVSGHDLHFAPAFEIEDPYTVVLWFRANPP